MQSSTQHEATRNTDFENVIATKQKQVITWTKSKDKKEGEKAAAESLLADTSASYDDTEAQMKADTAFFDSTKDQCEAKSSEWNTRSKLRESELAGVDKAIEILSSDAAREMFSKSIKPGMETSFLQVAKDTTDPAFKAYAALRQQARKSKSLRLASLAATVRLAKVGHFDEVIKSIDTMVQTLRDEGAADLAKRDQCNNEYQDIASKTADLSWQVEKNEAKIEKLVSLIEKRNAEKAKTIEDIQSVDDEMADMLKARTAEHKAFQQARSDDMAAITLLKSATESLTAYFNKNKVALTQADPEFEVSKDQAPEAKFDGKDSNANASKTIISLITMITEDLENEVSNGLKDEVSNQIAYEAAVETAKKLRKSLVEKKASLEVAIAKRGGDKTDETKDMKTNNEDKAAQDKHKADIKKDCDWMIKNFKVRADSRAAEMNGLEGAKEYLAGKAPSALLEQKETFDDNALPAIKFLGMKQ